MPVTLKKNTPRNTLRVGLSGKAGVGKTSAIFKLCKNPLIFDLENKIPPEFAGIGDLIDFKGRDSYKVVKDELLNILNDVKPPHDWLVIDTASKLESMAEQHAIQMDYGGNKSKFSAYQTGSKHELPQYFDEILDLLTRIQDKHGMNVLFICHAGTKLQNNIMGKDYYKAVLDLREGPMLKLLKWFDYLGFIWDDAQLDEEGIRTKVEKVNRVISFDNTSPFFDAKALKALPRNIPFDKDGKWIEQVFGKANNG